MVRENVRFTNPNFTSDVTREISCAGTSVEDLCTEAISFGIYYHEEKTIKPGRIRGRTNYGQDKENKKDSEEQTCDRRGRSPFKKGIL